MAPLSALNGHPNRTKVPGVETNTGPLGHGFPVAVGCASAARLRGLSYRTFVVLGDGELQEGSNWEAAMTAAHYDLADLTAIVDRNRLQQGARTEDTKQLEPLADKWESFDFEVREIDGHDFEQLLEALAPSTTGGPVAVIANTVKGKGVSFIEDRVEWHHKVPTASRSRSLCRSWAVEHRRRMPFSPESRLGDVLDSDEARAVVLEHLPMVPELPFPVQARHATIRQLVELLDLVRDDHAATARPVP